MAYLRKTTCSDHVTRNALDARNNEAYGLKATADSLISVQSFAIIKNTGHGNFVIGPFQTRARNGLSVLSLACAQSPPPQQTPFLRFFSAGRGRLYTGYLKWIIHLQTVRQNLRIKSGQERIILSWAGGLFIQNKNPFHFKLRRIIYLTRIIKRITHLTQIIRR